MNDENKLLKVKKDNYHIWLLAERIRYLLDSTLKTMTEEMLIEFLEAKALDVKEAINVLLESNYVALVNGKLTTNAPMGEKPTPPWNSPLLSGTPEQTMVWVDCLTDDSLKYNYKQISEILGGKLESVRPAITRLKQKRPDLKEKIERHVVVSDPKKNLVPGASSKKKGKPVVDEAVTEQADHKPLMDYKIDDYNIEPVRFSDEPSLAKEIIKLRGKVKEMVAPSRPVPSRPVKAELWIETLVGVEAILGDIGVPEEHLIRTNLREVAEFLRVK